MKCLIFSVLFLILTTESGCSPDNGFFISAPGVFHVGVNEKVFVQMGKSYLNKPVTLYLEHETNGIASAKKTVHCTTSGEILTVELMIERDKLVEKTTYLNLVAECNSFSSRKMTKVLVSKRMGNIFIQTSQPIYKPSEKVRYRIFTLDHTFRPYSRMFQISIFNAAGNRIMKSLRTAKGGIFQDTFEIPEVSKLGTWKIVARYEDDEKNVATQEFKVQKFVLPSFEVNIRRKQNYILLTDQQFNFTILAKYSHGEDVRGAYHCQFGVVTSGTTSGKKPEPLFIKGLELTGGVKDGTADASLSMAQLEMRLENQNITLNQLQKSGSQIYLRVYVTNIQSGEIQDADVYLPIISHKYTVDLSRTRSHFLPGYPLDVTVLVRHPDGSPAANVAIQVDVADSTEGSWQGVTNQEGAVFPLFNIPSTNQETLEVSTRVDGFEKSKVINRATSPSSSILYLRFANRMYSVGETLTVNYITINPPKDGFIYYMVLSRGILIKSGPLTIGNVVSDNLRITHNMVPSFRLIGYFHDEHGNIITDSVWVDVRDECEINVKVEPKGPFKPGKQSLLEFDLHGRRAKVALLAVDKAIYALHADNKLTARQVFSTMQSYDLGCTYSGGSDPASVLTDAGLSFLTQSQASWKRDFRCNSQSGRQRRSVDLELELTTLKSNFSDEKLRECCVQGFILIPMRRTCEERAHRVAVVKTNPLCAAAFLKCCIKGEQLRQKKAQEDSLKGFGRTATIADIEEFFLDTSLQYIRRYFPPSFAFIETEVNNKGSYSLALPDSITTWEIQVITLSADTGFCVVQPTEIKAFKEVFVSLTLPYSVRKYEQLSITPVIYNYGDETRQVAVHMAQTEGLCSPGSATTMAFVNITVASKSSQLVSFSAVPMVTGQIPIKIRLYDIENEMGIDAVQKTLNVLTEGMEKRMDETKLLEFNTRSTDTFQIDGSLPGDTVPDSSSNIFISAEANGFSSSHARNLLSPEKVASLIILPTGCLEQTMVKLAPTVSALRYLDLSEQWFDLPAGKRDETLDNVEKGYIHILAKKTPNGAYGSWRTAPYSNWMTALVVKVLSMVAERQVVAVGQTQGRRARVVPVEEITLSVNYLLSAQKSDGSFGDAHPVINRNLKTQDQQAYMTAFITVALQRSLNFLSDGIRDNVEMSIERATSYLRSKVQEIEHPYAVALTAYSLAVSMPKETDHSSTRVKLKGLAREATNGCYLWTTEANIPDADALTVQTTAYVLLAAVEYGDMKWAEKIACWLTTQENYLGGFVSSQDTIVALEALAEYELKRSASPQANLIAEFSTPGRRDVVKLELQNKNDMVETNLKKLVGNNITVKVKGQGDVKLKIVKAYHLLEPKDACNQVSITVTVEGKVKYTEKITENYEYYDIDDNNNYDEDTDPRVPRSAIEWFDAHTRNRRDVDYNLDSDGAVTYKVCVSHSQSRNLSGMAIADITLLSGFVAKTEDLDRLKQEPELYISHYEASYGRVLLYFNELFEPGECVSFDAHQKVAIGLLQPAPAVFYDYYEPHVKCTTFYSAPRRSKLVSKLCSEDVCQCAERPCHTIQNTFRRRPRMTKEDRFQHACFYPIVDYAYVVEVLSVSVKSNFEMYKIKVINPLKSYGDISVRNNAIRVFAKRKQCKAVLDVGKQYLIMGKDGATTDSDGMMQYLLESNTWVEKKPSEEECKKSAHRSGCQGFTAFEQEYRINGCTQ